MIVRIPIVTARWHHTGRATLGHGAMIRTAGDLEYVLSVMVPTGRWLVVCPD